MEGGPVVPAIPPHVAPIVHGRALELSVVEFKAKGLDQIEYGVGSGAEPGDISRVWWNFRLDQDDVHGSTQGVPQALLTFLTILTF